MKLFVDVEIGFGLLVIDSDLLAIVGVEVDSDLMNLFIVEVGIDLSSQCLYFSSLFLQRHFLFLFLQIE